MNKFMTVAVILIVGYFIGAKWPGIARSVGV